MSVEFQYGRVGPQTALSSGVPSPVRLDGTGAIVGAALHGKYFESTTRGKVFCAASTAATTWSVALTATYTGLCISNPAGSAVDLVPLQVGFALSVAPVAIASIHLIGGYTAAGVVTHTTALATQSTRLDGIVSPAIAKADAAATIVVPLYLMPLVGGFTAGALFGTSPTVVDLNGAFVIPPGGWMGIGALTAVIGFGSFVWEEVTR